LPTQAFLAVGLCRQEAGPSTPGAPKACADLRFPRRWAINRALQNRPAS